MLRPCTRAHLLGHCASQPRELGGGLSLNDLCRWAAVYEVWKVVDTQLIADMACCCSCGRTAFGGRYSRLRRHFKKVQVSHDNVPIAAQANPFLFEVMKAGPPSMPGMQPWWFCRSCHDNPRRQHDQSLLQQPMSEQHAQDLCQLINLPGGALLYASLMRCPVRFSQRAKCLLHATETNKLPIMGGPLVAFSEDDQADDSARVVQVSSMAELSNQFGISTSWFQ
jgi:hypothetical protein